MIINDPHEEQRYAVHSVPTIAVIERPAESYEEFHQRKLREQDGAKRVPFGFARALNNEEE